MMIFMQIATVVSFLAFLGLVWWAYDRKRQSQFEEAANLPFSLPDELELAKRS